MRTTPEAFSRRFAGTAPCRMVMEVGTHSPWASKLLAGQGHEVFVANPWKVKLISASITKTDRSVANVSTMGVSVGLGVTVGVGVGDGVPVAVGVGVGGTPRNRYPRL